MEQKAKVYLLENRKTITGKDLQDVVIEWVSQGSDGKTYPRKAALVVFNDNIEKFALKVGEEATFFFDANAREHNGRWYNDSFILWRVDPINSAPAPQPAPQPSSDLQW